MKIAFFIFGIMVLLSPLCFIFFNKASNYTPENAKPLYPELSGNFVSQEEYIQILKSKGIEYQTNSMPQEQNKEPTFTSAREYLDYQAKIERKTP